jgi:hypothetical protein
MDSEPQASMKLFGCLVLACLVPLAMAQKKQAQPKPPEIEVIEVAARREDSLLTVDLKLRNAGERAAKKLVVIFEVLDSDKNVLTRQQGEIEEPELEPGEESEINVQMAMHARAVQVRFSFEDGSGRDLKALKPGPYPIE